MPRCYLYDKETPVSGTLCPSREKSTFGTSRRKERPEEEAHEETPPSYSYPPQNFIGLEAQIKRGVQIGDAKRSGGDHSSIDATLLRAKVGTFLQAQELHMHFHQEFVEKGRPSAYLVYMRDDCTEDNIAIGDTPVAVGRERDPRMLKSLNIDGWDVVAYTPDGIRPLCIRDGTVSRKKPGCAGHAKFYLKGSSFYVVDLKSTNHTYCNERCLEPTVPQVLQPGDIVRLGVYTQLRVECDLYRITVQKGIPITVPKQTAEELGIDCTGQFITISTRNMGEGVYKCRGREIFIREPDKKTDEERLTWNTFLTERRRLIKGDIISGDVILKSILPELQQILNPSNKFAQELVQELNAIKEQYYRTEMCDVFRKQLDNWIGNLQKKAFPDTEEE